MKSAPVLLQSVSDTGRSLERIDARSADNRNEAWIQRLIFEHPELLPVAEFDEAYTPLVPAGREVETSCGYIDVLYLTPSGAIVIVETKLWQNPERHRTVVAQLLDYAKDLSRWTYDDLSKAVLKASRTSAPARAQSLDELITPYLSPLGLGLPDFQERVISALSKGKFLLLVVGDRISANLALLTESIAGAPGLLFTLGLLELQLYRIVPGEDWPVVVVPDIVGRTVEVTRGVIEVQYVQERPKVIVEVADAEPPRPNKGKTTQQVFLSKCPADLAPVYEQWLATWRDRGLVIYWGTDGFSVRFRAKEKLTTLLDAYPEWALSLIREADVARLGIGEQAYRQYLEAITVVPEAISILSTGKKYIRHDSLTADKLTALLSAATSLVPTHSE